MQSNANKRVLLHFYGYLHVSESRPPIKKYKKPTAAAVKWPRKNMKKFLIINKSEQSEKKVEKSRAHVHSTDQVNVLPLISFLKHDINNHSERECWSLGL